MSEIRESLKRAALGRYPLIYLAAWDEDRALRAIEGFARKLYPQVEPAIVTWSCVRGFSDPAAPRITDPVAAIDHIVQASRAGFYVLLDLVPYFGRPEVVRALREAYYALRSADRTLVVTWPRIDVPEALSKEMFVVELGAPDVEELARLIEGFARSYGAGDLDGGRRTEMAFTLKGLSLNEATHTLHRVFRSKLSREGMLEEIRVDKERTVKKAGYLEYVPPDARIDQMGGLENLKAWLERRKQLFSQKAIDEGVPPPKGMLVMGMSGCGKSLAAKVVSSLWDVALFRLDMSLINSGIYGSPEAAFDRALRTIEGLAPAVLWIDEIENSLGMDEVHSGSNPGVFSTFLTWMQEKPPLIFVAATANRISALPAEVIRKGRFDQVFFVDLPTPEERKDIFRIHLQRNGGDTSQFDLEVLAIATKGWAGSEIEQAVASARVDAYHEARPFTMADVTRNTTMMVPLSKTMHEQLKKIRNWAFGRATLASKDKYNES